jgi:hypothetical protein
MNTLTTVFNSLQSAPVHFTAIHLRLNHLYHPDRIDNALAVLMRLGLLCMESERQLLDKTGRRYTIKRKVVV